MSGSTMDKKRCNFTELDKFVPVGEPIHPYDFAEIMNDPSMSETVDVIKSGSSPPAVNEDDYRRNQGKQGTTVIFQNKTYFVTTSAECKTRNIR